MCGFYHCIPSHQPSTESVRQQQYCCTTITLPRACRTPAHVALRSPNRPGCVLRVADGVRNRHIFSAPVPSEVPKRLSLPKLCLFSLVLDDSEPYQDEPANYSLLLLLFVLRAYCCAYAGPLRRIHVQSTSGREKAAPVCRSYKIRIPYAPWRK